MLDTYREANQVFWYLQVRARHGLVGHKSGNLDERFDSIQI